MNRKDRPMMNCQLAIEKISEELDGQLSANEAFTLHQHLAQCSCCSSYYAQLRGIQASLRHLPSKSVPAELTWRLRILASKELQRQQRCANWRASLQYHFRLLQLSLDGWKPAALSLVAGLVAATVLFSFWAPIYATASTNAQDDVPITIATKPSLRSSLFTGLPTEDVIVEVLIDGQGRMLDYWPSPGQRWHADPKLRRSVENALLCTQFQPATHFGRPTPSILRIFLRHNRVDVEG